MKAKATNNVNFALNYGLIKRNQATVAQWIRHRPPKPGIAGSSPAGGWWPFTFALEHISYLSDFVK